MKELKHIVWWEIVGRYKLFWVSQLPCSVKQIADVRNAWYLGLIPFPLFKGSRFELSVIDLIDSIYMWVVVKISVLAGLG